MNKKTPTPVGAAADLADSGPISEPNTSSENAAIAEPTLVTVEMDGQVRWEQPLNFLSEMMALPFTVEHVPPSLGTYPAAYATQTGIDFGIALGAVLATAAAALDDKFQIVADEATGYRQSARLWILALAPSGSGKSPAQAHMRAPLDAVARFETALYDGRVAAAKSKLPANTGPDAGARIAKPRVIVNDPTMEALTEVLRDTHRGILVATDEAASWLGSMDAYKSKGVSKDRGDWLRLFDGGVHTVERIQRGSITIPNFGVSLLTGTTPTALVGLSRQLPEDGLLQRFISIVSPRQHDGEAVAHISVTRRAYENLIESLYRLNPSGDGNVRMTLAAKSAFAAWRRENRAQQAGFESVHPGLAAHIAKHPTMALRLALLFHCAELVAINNVRLEDTEVTEECLRLAFAFLKRTQSHAVALYLGLKGQSDVMEIARDAAKSILAHELMTIGRRELIQKVRAFRGADVRRQDDALRLLVDMCWLRPVRRRDDSSRPTRFDVNPGIYMKFGELATQERERRLQVRAVIAESILDRRSGW
jgi:hypothetical protein